MSDASAPLKAIDHTIVNQAWDAEFEARTLKSPVNGRLYLVLRHPRDNPKKYSYYVLEATGSHHFVDVENDASAREYSGVVKGDHLSHWWEIWPEKK